MATTYNVEFNAGSTGATGLPARQTKTKGKTLVLPSTKPTKASKTDSKYKYTYAFQYWEGTPISDNVTTSTKTSSSQTYTWPQYATWLTNAPLGIDYQPKVKVTATTGGYPKVSVSKTLAKGDTGSEVLAIQKRLNALGYLTVTPDGVYGDKTVAAVNAFQLANGLGYSDSKVGSWTVSKLNGNPIKANGSVEMTVRITIRLDMIHTYGDCTGDGFWYSFDGGSTWDECWVEGSFGAVHYVGDVTTCSYTKVVSNPKQASFINVLVQPYRYQPSSYGYYSYGDGTQYLYNGYTYIDCSIMIYKVVWNKDGIEVHPAATKVDDTVYTKKQYKAGANYTIDAPITLYPVFTETKTAISTDHYVTYNSNTSDAVKNMPSKQTKKKGTALTLSLDTVPTRSNYIFTGWYTDTAATKKRTEKSYSTEADLTLYAGWRKIDYIITFDANGYSGVKNLPATIYKTAGIDIKLPTQVPTIDEFTKNDYKYTYKFDHWEANQTETSTKTTSTTKTTTTSKTTTSSSQTVKFPSMAQWWAYYSEQGVTVTPTIKVTAKRTSSTKIDLTFDFTMLHDYGDWTGCGFWYSVDGGSTWTTVNPTSTFEVHYMGTKTNISRTKTVTTSSSAGFLNVSIQPFTFYYKNQNYPLHDAYYDDNYSYCKWAKKFIKIPYTAQYIECTAPTASYVADKKATETVYTTETITTNKVVNYAAGATYKVDQTTNMYAVFNETKTQVTKYNIKFNANGGNQSTCPATQVKTHDVPLVLSSTKPTRNDGYEGSVKYKYTFKIWNMQADGGGDPYTPGVTTNRNANFTLYAQWNKTNITPYTWKFNANGGTQSTCHADITKVHDVDTYMDTTPVPTRPDGYEGSSKYSYEWNGWTTNADGSGTPYARTFTTTYNGNRTLYAQWKKTNITPYTFHFDANGGTQSTCPPDMTKIHGINKAIPTTKPTRPDGWEGDYKYEYTFKNWNTKADGTGTTVSSGGTVSGNANYTLYAQWSKKNITPYTITFDGNGGTVNIKSVTKIYGVDLTVSNAYATLANSTKTYTIIYQTNGYLTTGADCRYKADSPISSVSDTFTDTYKWKQVGWNTKKDGSGTSYSKQFTIKVNANTTLYAQYELDTINYGKLFPVSHDFKLNDKKEDGYKVITMPRKDEYKSQTLTAIDTISYTFKKWQQINPTSGNPVSGVVRETYNEIKSTVDCKWKNTKNTGTHTCMTYSNMQYETILRPIWERKVKVYGTVTLPTHSKVAFGTDGSYYKFCNWTDKTTWKDGFTKVTPTHDNYHVYGIWEVIFKDNVLITSDYLYNTNVIRSWYRLLTEIANQKTAEGTPADILKSTDKAKIVSPFVQNYNKLIETDNLKGDTYEHLTLYDQISLLKTAKDSQNRCWFSDMSSEINDLMTYVDEYVQEGYPVLQKLRDTITKGLVSMRKYVKVYGT